MQEEGDVVDVASRCADVEEPLGGVYGECGGDNRLGKGESSEEVERGVKRPYLFVSTEQIINTED
jgi:hypothetical protein